MRIQSGGSPGARAGSITTFTNCALHFRVGIQFVRRAGPWIDGTTFTALCAGCVTAISIHTVTGQAMAGITARLAIGFTHFADGTVAPGFFDAMVI
jgi:hypothetical protein